MFRQGVRAKEEEAMLRASQGSGRNTATSHEIPSSHGRNRWVDATVAEKQTQMFLQRLAMLQGVLQGQSLSPILGSLEAELGHGSTQGADCHRVCSKPTLLCH